MTIEYRFIVFKLKLRRDIMNEPGRHVRRPYDSNTGKRKKRRRKKKGVGRFVFLCVLIVGVIAGGFTLFNIITSEIGRAHV